MRAGGASLLLAPALAACALALAACAREPSETYGLVATLGDDTTSVERVVRTGDRIVSDQVGRSPLVVRRHWEGTLAPDGSLLRWSMDTHVPNAPGGARELHHAADFTGDAVRFTRVVDGDTSRFAYRKSYAVTVPWNAFVYGTWEVLLDAARGLPDTTHVGQYFFEGWDEGHVGWARVRDLGGGTYAVRSTGLSGTGEAHLDAGGRMTSYSGEGTTYKQEVRRVEAAPDVDAIFERFAAAEKAAGAPSALSERGTTRATVGDARVVIDYGRPHARGRTLVGGLIPYDRVWRTGANAATQLETSAPMRLAGVDLDAGKYTLWTLPTRTGVQLIINGQTGQWGTQYGHDHDIARAPMDVDSAASPVERFTIRVEPGAGSGSGRLVMEWGTFRWSATLESRPRASAGAPIRVPPR